MIKNLGTRISDIDRHLDDKAWTLRVDAISRAGALLAECDDEPTLHRVLGLIERGVRDAKWEVRKAAAFVLGTTSGDGPATLLATLAQDENPWVKKAALVAQRRSGGASRSDETLDRMFAVIQKLKKRSLPREAMLELARFFGDLHYEDLASETAHELRSVVTAIEGQALVIDDRMRAVGREDPVTADASAKLRQWTKVLARTVDDLCEYTANRGEIGPVPLAEVVRQAFDSARARIGPGQMPAGVELLAEVAPEIVLEADAERLARAFGNLICNAVQAIPEGAAGSVRVTAELVDASMIEVRIIDTGRGMDAHQVQEARRRYKTLRKAQGGIGLGVPIAERIIDREHGGRLHIESALDQGTTIRVSLPTTQPREERR